MGQSRHPDDQLRGDTAFTGRALAARVEALGRGLEDLRGRMERLEGRLEERSGERPAPGKAAVPAPATAVVAEAAPAVVVAGPVDGAVEEPAAPAVPHGAGNLPEELTYAGRVLLVLGGAYLLRAVTEAGLLPAVPGVFLGIVYGLTWAALAWRAATRGAHHAAVAHGLASAMVGFPLVWETTVRFQLLAPALGALLLLAYALALFAVAWARDLPALAWVTGVGAFATGVATMFGTATLPPFVAVLVLLGGAVLVGAVLGGAVLDRSALGVSAPAGEPARGWWELAWATAGATDLAVVVLLLGAGFERSGVPPVAALAVLLLLPAVYVGLFGGFALAGRQRIGPFALVQSALAVLLGVGGALVALGRVPRLAPLVGGGLLLAAVAAYALAFRGVERSRRRPFHYFGTLGTVLALAGTWLLLPGPAPLWAVLVPVAAALGWWLGRPSLLLHASLFAAAAAWASGLLINGLAAFTRSGLVEAAAGAWISPPGSAALLTLAAALFALAFPLSTPADSAHHRLRHGPPLVLLSIAVWGLMALAVWLGAGLLEGAADGAGGVAADGPDAGWLAALRTSVLAAAAVAMAALSRWRRFRFAGWLVYPLLALGGVKLVAQDLMAGRPATLVVSFLAFGVALIAAPRLRRAVQPAATASGASEGDGEEA